MLAPVIPPLKKNLISSLTSMLYSNSSGTFLEKIMIISSLYMNFKIIFLLIFFGCPQKTIPSRKSEVIIVKIKQTHVSIVLYKEFSCI